MFDFFSFFNRIFGGPREDTRSAARDRLRLVLVSDRATVAPQLMESLRNELIEVISRYMEIDTCSMQMGLERHEGVMALA
ncbi:MAG: cell division topological specificity factor MinE, partial [Burkholderiales bacterium]|nr:cell division topological specificity factor MinE [Burkholderiales bacterium]